MPGDDRYRDLKVSGRRNRRASLLLGALLAALLVLPAPADAAFPGANGKIAFSGQCCFTEIEVVNPDGSGRTPLTSNGAESGQPAWPPDGSKVAFQFGTEITDDIP